MTLTPARTTPSLGELRRAWLAIERGDFRTEPSSVGPARQSIGPDASEGWPDAAEGVQHQARLWEPGGQVVSVIGAVPQCGATTTALAMATAVGAGVVIECASGSGSGLTSAATAELGISPRGWTHGRRGNVQIARQDRSRRSPERVPLPDQPTSAADVSLWLLDVSWDLAHVLATPGWIRQAVFAAPAVVVGSPTVPGMRRLEATLNLLTGGYAVVAMAGPARRRWPRHVRAAAGSLTRRAAEEGRLVNIPFDKHLATRGLDDTPLPGRLLTAAAELTHKIIAAPAADAAEASDEPTTPERSPS